MASHRVVPPPRKRSPQDATVRHVAPRKETEREIRHAKRRLLAVENALVLLFQLVGATARAVEIEATSVKAREAARKVVERAKRQK